MFLAGFSRRKNAIFLKKDFHDDKKALIFETLALRGAMREW